MVVTGAVIIAGIGFAGSYAAVRELALEKGFGNFSYVFPIGIDAGICVLLALDLLLTWIRIPFPLLRHTAWLLTAATIAFNGAAAWPDPLGTGMHAVIPILFVVSVEAARHAIGRIADITADKHMEGVRITRWLLSPVPTFLLWRRMKLWELRSYDQVIKLEQERLVYQARLRSRFGRAWRRKAPVESLMPLRLARYGVPLAQTTPAGLTAAGVEPALPPSVPSPGPAPQQQLTAGPDAAQDVAAADRTPLLPRQHVQASTPQHPEPRPSQSSHQDSAESAGHVAHLSTAQGTAWETQPADAHSALQHPDHYDMATPGSASLPGKQLAPPARRTAPTAPTSPPSPTPRSRPTTVDRYCQAWTDFHHQYQRYPDAAELSAHLADHGILDRSQQPIKPKSLSRYLLQFRLYTTWAQHRATTHTPDLHRITQELTDHGITAQYNKPLHPHHLTPHLHAFEQRWRILNPDVP
ncbi:DUF2637 domain-containing protein [Streptomyces sp. FL07-04A]|uniref:DUF2637 domain-containing protein n=1 Tax=Streptomyces sp. FL07-04A TaxID=3028658 RepID=UPI0029A0FEDC|nr:DUF2637 domain-containing protein [Streptomyces sp. FL07-04A]MDX3579223.1 DUF2637 domain-containing protein [Streptomyces sp. FL07-04A]